MFFTGNLRVSSSEAAASAAAAGPFKQLPISVLVSLEAMPAHTDIKKATTSTSPKYEMILELYFGMQ